MTAPERQLDRLPERAEALLDGWPAPSRGALEWEDAAARTMERVRETPIGSTSDLLLEAPLAEESGEGSLSPVLVAAEPSSDVEDEPPMLANIARAVVAATASASAKDVAREMMLAAEEGRRSAPPAPPQSKEAYRSRGAEAHLTAALQGAPVQAMHEATARSELPARDVAPKRNTFGLVAFGGGAALALAAGAALYVSVRGEGRAVLTEPSAEAPQAIARASATTAENPAEPRDDPARSAVALDVLPAAPGKSELQEPSPKSAVPNPATGVTKDSLAFRMKNAPPGAGKLVLEERNEEDVPAQKETPAAAPAQGAKNPASAEEPGLPPQPSLGAVQAAVGSVMTGARSCLAGQDSGSKATVKFGATGRVISVVLSGPAAGTPAESCVRSALMGARVPPFSEPSFAASLTIRPP
jgi:hypothetical protein